MKSSILSTVILLVASRASAAASVGEVVDTTVGPVQGTSSKLRPDVSAYLGIPYAKPPVGDLRFEPAGQGGSISVDHQCHGICEFVLTQQLTNVTDKTRARTFFQLLRSCGDVDCRQRLSRRSNLRRVGENIRQSR